MSLVGDLSLYSWPARNIQSSVYSRTNCAPSLYIWPVQITQSNGGDCQHRILSNVANPIHKDLLSATPRQSKWQVLLPLHWLAYLYLQLDLLDIADYIVFVLGFATFVPFYAIGSPFPFQLTCNKYKIGDRLNLNLLQSTGDCCRQVQYRLNRN